MPNCFSLTPKGQDKPESLSIIDEKICQELNRPSDDQYYCLEWYDRIGFSLACGRTFAELKDRYVNNPEMLKIVVFLDANYTVNAWAER